VDREFPLVRDDSYGMFEYACHEGNRAMFNILSGARADDRAAAAKNKSPLMMTIRSCWPGAIEVARRRPSFRVEPSSGFGTKGYRRDRPALAARVSGCNARSDRPLRRLIATFLATAA